MSSVIKVSITLAAIISGGILSNIGWNIRLNPYWLNTVFFTSGVVLMAGGMLYALIRVVARLQD